MDYKDAIEYLRANDIKKDDGSFYEFGDVSVNITVCRKHINPWFPNMQGCSFNFER